jgi:hypothetical protein
MKLSAGRSQPIADNGLEDIPMQKLQIAISATLVAAFSAASPVEADAAPMILSKNFAVQTDVIQIRDGVRWRNGSFGPYRHYRPRYHNNDWYPAGALIAGAIIGGALANNSYYGNGFYGSPYYGSRYSRNRYYDDYPRRVYQSRRSSYGQGYSDGYRAGYNDGAYGGGNSCNQRSADAGRC